MKFFSWLIQLRANRTFPTLGLDRFAFTAELGVGLVLERYLLPSPFWRGIGDEAIKKGWLVTILL